MTYQCAAQSPYSLSVDADTTILKGSCVVRVEDCVTSDDIGAWLREYTGPDVRYSEPSSLEIRYIGRLGQAFAPAPLPEGIEMQTLGQEERAYHACAINSQLSGLQYGLRYVEGFAIRRSDPLVQSHCWNLDGQGNVVDTTWKDGTACFGAEVPRPLFRELMADRGYSLVGPLLRGFESDDAALEAHLRAQGDGAHCGAGPPG